MLVYRYNRVPMKSKNSGSEALSGKVYVFVESTHAGLVWRGNKGKHIDLSISQQWCGDVWCSPDSEDGKTN